MNRGRGQAKGKGKGAENGKGDKKGGRWRKNAQRDKTRAEDWAGTARATRPRSVKGPSLEGTIDEPLDFSKKLEKTATYWSLQLQ